MTSSAGVLSKVHPRAPNNEIGRSGERMLQATAKQGDDSDELEARLQSNLDAIKSSKVRGRRSHDAQFLWVQDVLNYSAIFITLGGFTLGTCILLFSTSWLLRASSMVLLAYVKILSFLVHHELVHGNMFAKRSTNQAWGGLIDVVNGAQYWTFEDLQRQHIEHHQDKVDYVSFDAPELMRWLPYPVEKLVVCLEYFYFPALAYITHWRSVTAVYWHPGRKHARSRTTVVVLLRSLCYALMAWINPTGLFLYFLSHNLFINCYRVLDCFSHTFEELPVGSEAPKGLTAAYEQNRTVSLMATRSRNSWLNLLFLNFGYHGAHHIDPTGPWLAYNKLDSMIFEGCGSDMPRHVALLDLLVHFHRERIHRIYNEKGMGVPAVDEKGNLSTRLLFGVLDPSILMLEVAPLPSKIH